MLCSASLDRLRSEERSRVDSAASSATSREFDRRLRLHYGCRQGSEVRRSIRKILQARGIQSRGIDRYALRPSHCSEHGGDFNDIQFAYATRIYARFVDAGPSHRIPHSDSIRGLAPTGYEHPIEYRSCADYSLGICGPARLLSGWSNNRTIRCDYRDHLVRRFKLN